MAIGNCRSGPFFAVVNDPDVDFVGAKTWRDDNVIHSTSINVELRQKPQPFSAVCALGGEHRPLALLPFKRVKEMRSPARRPLRLANRTKQWRNQGNGTIQSDRERFGSLPEGRLGCGGHKKARDGSERYDPFKVATHRIHICYDIVISDIVNLKARRKDVAL